LNRLALRRIWCGFGQDETAGSVVPAVDEGLILVVRTLTDAKVSGAR
jgi:hypothetical protein